MTNIYELDTERLQVIGEPSCMPRHAFGCIGEAPLPVCQRNEQYIVAAVEFTHGKLGSPAELFPEPVRGKRKGGGGKRCRYP